MLCVGEILPHILDEATKKIVEGRAIDVVHMEFGMVFDKIPHGRLVQKIKTHGIQGELVSLIQNLLNVRCRGWRWNHYLLIGNL